MLIQPRKPKFLDQHKLRTRARWENKNSQLNEGFIFLTKRCKLKPKHFEIVRLRLLRITRLQRRLSTKARFKMKRSAKATVFVMFKRSSFYLRIIRLFWFTGFPHIATTHDTKNTRMGKGKGHIRHWYFLGHPGAIIIRFGGLRPASLKYIVGQITKRLPGKPLGGIIHRNLESSSFSFFSPWI